MPASDNVAVIDRIVAAPGQALAVVLVLHAAVWTALPALLYANLPLDGLWLRGPYLHNGAVPTLRNLLAPPAQRPDAFVRGIDVLDGRNGGFVSPPCAPGQPLPQGFCYDTRLPGNGNGGHVYGAALSAPEKDDLIAYLLTF